MSANRWVCLLVALLAVGCKSGDSDASDGGGGTDLDAGGVDAGPPCAADEDCDDRLFCTGEERCEKGQCAAGEPVTCSDGLACTIDKCSERKRQCEFLAPDLDSDGHYEAACEGKDGKPLGDDCDDDDPLRFPGNIESCDADHHDEDCDASTFGEKDSDDDGYFDAECCNAKSDDKGAALLCGDDCDDLKAAVSPKATEACDQFDNDCDGETDEGVSRKMYPDVDRDGHGATTGAKSQCAGTVGYALEPNDCDDRDPEVFEGQFEICDKKDNNCSGEADEVQDDAPWFMDVDEDGFGDATSTPIYSCERIPGRVLSSSDCDDTKAALHPAAAEACDAVDNDCNGKRDFRLGTNDFEDDDGDGIPDIQCTGGLDCADKDPTSGRGLDEVCDTRDNDCDGAIDEETAQTVWYLDRDGDGWGIDVGTALARCEPIPGRAANLGDCDDEVNAVHPTALELCNGQDENCNGKADEGTNYQCVLSSAVGYCKLGGCAVLSCFPGFGDCNQDPSDGCECDAPIVPFSSPCSSDAECDDDDYCNGRERCVGAACYRGTPINCDASDSVLQGSFFIRNSLDIQSLGGIETITGDLVISANGLVNLTGLESLKTVGGNLMIDGVLDTLPDVQSNQALVALVGSGLSNLTTVTGDLIIEDNPQLTIIRLPSLVTVGGMLVIRQNDALTTLDGFDALVKVTGSLQIQNNYELTSLPGMRLLGSTGGLHVNNNLLQRLKLPALTRVRGDVDVSLGQEFESPLESLELPKLTQIDGSLYVQHQYELQTLSMPLLKKVLGTELYITMCSKLDDPDLHSLTQLTAADTVFVPDGFAQLRIEGNTSLTSLTRLGALTCPSSNCNALIQSNPMLSSCDIATLAQSFTDVPANWYGNLNSSPDGGPSCTDGSTFP